MEEHPEHEVKALLSRLSIASDEIQMQPLLSFMALAQNDAD